MNLELTEEQTMLRDSISRFAENELNVGMLPDDRFLDSQMENIKKGGTVQSAIAYELDDTTTPVELVASDDLGFSEIGRVTYQLK